MSIKLVFLRIKVVYVDEAIILNIFIAFFRSGMLGFGGGPSSIPLVHKEVVGTFKWMDDDEFSDVLALGNTLPGPINTKMAGYIGYRVGGIMGHDRCAYSCDITNGYFDVSYY